jgi:hypothetical protein
LHRYATEIPDAAGSMAPDESAPGLLILTLTKLQIAGLSVLRFLYIFPGEPNVHQSPLISR